MISLHTEIVLWRKRRVKHWESVAPSHPWLEPVLWNLPQFPLLTLESPVAGSLLLRTHLLPLAGHGEHFLFLAVGKCYLYFRNSASLRKSLETQWREWMTLHWCLCRQVGWKAACLELNSLLLHPRRAGKRHFDRFLTQDMKACSTETNFSLFKRFLTGTALAGTDLIGRHGVQALVFLRRLD